MANALLILSWVLFYFLHTALASGKLKRFLEAKWPRFYKNYRLYYTIFSTLLFSGIFFQALFLPVHHLFDSRGFPSYLGYLLATLGIVVLSRSMKEISVNNFLLKEEKKTTELIQKGIYSKTRHPLYLGIMLIFLGYFLVAGTMGSLIHLACLVLYLPFGIYFEEKNLIALFGENYKKYKQEIPAFFPKIFN